MTENQIIEILNKSWEMEEGYFYEIRIRKFDPNKGDSIYNLLKKISIEEDEFINRKLVRLLWYIPIYLEYQKSTLKPVLSMQEYNRYIKLSNNIQTEVERILGYP